MEELKAFFSNKKKATNALIALCALALLFVLITPMGNIGAMGFSKTLTGDELSELCKGLDKSSFFVKLFYICPIAAAVLTLYKNDKQTRWIAGLVFILPILFFLMDAPSFDPFDIIDFDLPGLDKVTVSVSMGSGTIIYLILSLCYFVGNYFTKE